MLYIFCKIRSPKLPQNRSQYTLKIDHVALLTLRWLSLRCLSASRFCCQADCLAVCLAATKSVLQGPQSTAHATKSALQGQGHFKVHKVLNLLRDLHFKVHTKSALQGPQSTAILPLTLFWTPPISGAPYWPPIKKVRPSFSWWGGGVFLNNQLNLFHVEISNWFPCTFLMVLVVKSARSNDCFLALANHTI